jgi:hypothetical protein
MRRMFMRRTPKKYLVKVNVIYNYECEISASSKGDAEILGCRLFHEKPELVPSDQHPSFKATATKIVLTGCVKEDI